MFSGNGLRSGVSDASGENMLAVHHYFLVIFKFVPPII